GLVVRLPADRPRVLLVVASPRRGAGGDEELRHLRLVQVVPNRGLRLGAEAANEREDLVLLYQLARELDGVRGVVAVVEDLEADLAPVDAALAVLALAGIDPAEVCGHPAGDRRVRRRRTAERERG